MVEQQTANSIQISSLEGSSLSKADKIIGKDFIDE
jgi:hypothetical protein